MTEPILCITCAAIRGLCLDDCDRDHRHRRGNPNPVETGLTCDPCRLALTRLPADIADAYRILVENQLDLPSMGKTGDGRAKRPEAPLPFIIDPVDLTGPWRMPQGPIRQARLAANADLQDGHMPVRETLWWRIQDILTHRTAGETGPDTTVEEMCRWLSARADWITEAYPPVDEYAAELAHLHGVLQALVGRSEPDERPKPFPVPCPRCRRMSLVRRFDMAVECQWPDCARVFTESEWNTVTKATANAIRRGQLRQREDVTT